jgi:DNA modification methylase
MEGEALSDAVTLHVGDCRTVLASLPAGSVNCCVTSPPYYGLRDYKVAGQIGLEPTLAEYVAEMVAVFREVRRVLADDGTLWLNLGDSYAGSWGNQGRKEDRGSQRPINGPMMQAVDDDRYPSSGSKTGSLDRAPGLKSKDLMGVPWRVAFALQADGWYLRQDIIWHKPAPMPLSVRDRCTTAHEYLFLLSKSPRYYYDADAIAEPAVTAGKPIKMADGWDTGPGGHGAFHRDGREKGQYLGVVQSETRNKRSVWTIPTRPYPEAHFATYPPDLIRPCVLAGCPEGGVVLDPFGGSGTTAAVASKLGRRCVTIELNPDYAGLIRKRFTLAGTLFAGAG